MGDAEGEITDPRPSKQPAQHDEQLAAHGKQHVAEVKYNDEIGGKAVEAPHDLPSGFQQFLNPGQSRAGGEGNEDVGDRVGEVAVLRVDLDDPSTVAGGLMW